MGGVLNSYHAEIPFEARMVHSEAQLLTRQKILVFLLSSDCEDFRGRGGYYVARPTARRDELSSDPGPDPSPNTLQQH